MRSIYGILAAAMLAGIPGVLAEEVEEAQSLRERLTEREDETRVEDPWVLDVLGRPLSVLGQYEATLTYIDRLGPAAPNRRYEMLFLAQEIELEAFYVVSDGFSLFAQGSLIHGEDLHSDVPDDVSATYTERGEMWAYAESLAGLPVSLEVGRLDFEDDRLWWWDEGLDAVRLIYETDTFEVAVAAARELASVRSDQSYVEPEHDDVLRLIAEISWDWDENHDAQLFLLNQDDRSGSQRLRSAMDPEREDDSDAGLTWLGARVAGAFALNDRGLLGYWADAGYVRGDERLYETEDEDVVEADRRVRAWALDAGATYMLPTAGEPRLTLGYARASGDQDGEDRTDKAYHQTGLHGNEPGFGGVQRFLAYGQVLDPELSNLSVLTAGIGLSLFESSSLDLVYHYYRLVEPADSLRDARIEAELTGTDRDLGHGIDLMLAVEEWERFETEFAASAFRAGDAFGDGDGDWVLAGHVAFRVAF